MLHRAAYEALGLSHWSYRRDDVPAGHLAAHLAGLDDTWAGLSVTMPGKEEALRASARASPRALRTGAANTLVRVQEGWWADNTDIDGITRAFAEHGCATAATAWLIGSGATARSALVALSDMGVGRLIVQVREEPRRQTIELAHTLSMDLTVRRYDEGWPELATVDVAISTVPSGASVPPAGGMPSPSSAQPRARSAGPVAMDVVYHPRQTPWARAVSTMGGQLVDGSAMLLHQAAVQVELMTGCAAPVAAMRAALNTALAARG